VAGSDPNRYHLYRQPEAGRRSYDGGWGQPAGAFPSLSDAMRAAGHPDPAHWYTIAGMPDVIFVDWALYYGKTRPGLGHQAPVLPWSIEAPGVADEYTDLLTADVIPGGGQ
jgi:hypothetical protein